MKISNLLILTLVLISLLHFLDIESTQKLYDKDEILVPVSVHLVDDDTVQFRTKRDIDNIGRIFEEVNRIWAKAQIRFIVSDVDIIKMDNKEFGAVFYGEIEYLTKRKDFDEGIINGYFARYINSNGISFPAQGFFIIGDVINVNDYRATSHELGHLLGLHHVDNKDYLMQSGSNGELLDEKEIEIARKNARRVYEITI